MPITHETYIVHLPKDQALAALKAAAEAQRLRIEEESDSGFFCLERWRLLGWVFSGASSRIAVSVEDVQGQTIARMVTWGLYHAARSSKRMAWRLLDGSGLASSVVPAGVVGPGPRGVDVWKPAPDPSWVSGMRLVTIAPWVLALPVLVAAIWIGTSFNAWYGLALICFWAVITLLVPPVVSDVVSRRKLGIRSRRGVVSNASVAAVILVAYFAATGLWEVVFP